MPISGNQCITGNGKTYNAGLYVRLSREDEHLGQSESIQNQKDYLKAYALEQGFNIYNIYTDDGYSGLNFDRPGFKSMIADIESGHVNLVVTKDLSRLGRDYIDTGYYLERYFPRADVRYIAPNDGIDTFERSANNDMSPFKSVINDMYAKDISKKVRAVMDTKRMNGQFIGAFAPFGYVKDPHNKNKLLIDRDAAEIVRRIYNMYIGGLSMTKIAAVFNLEKVLTPTQYKNRVQKLRYVNVNAKFGVWRTETVKAILSNPTYAGCLTQRRNEKVSYKLKYFKKIKKGSWITVENTHEPIVERTTFNIVQKMLEKKTGLHYPKRESHMMSGLLHCGDCGSPMTFRRRARGKSFIIVCSGNSRFGREKCSRHTMDEQSLNRSVIHTLVAMSNGVINADSFCKAIYASNTGAGDTASKYAQERTSNRLDEIKTLIKSLYEDKVKGILSEEDFINLSAAYHTETETLLSNRESPIKKRQGARLSGDETVSIIQSVINFDTVSRAVLIQLIKKIEVFENNNIVIHCGFRYPFNNEIDT